MKRILLIAVLSALTLNLALWSQAVTVSAPIAGDVWCIGEEYSINWSQAGTKEPNIDIRLRLAGSPDANPPALAIVDDTENDGTHSWLIPAAVAPGNYFIRVKTDTVVGDSAVFTISTCALRPNKHQDVTTRMILVTIPADGSAFEFNSTDCGYSQKGKRCVHVPCRWRADNCPADYEFFLHEVGTKAETPIELEYYKNEGDGVISASIILIEGTVAPGWYKIHVKCPGSGGYSGKFQIK